MSEPPLHNSTLRVAGQELPCAIVSVSTVPPASWLITLNTRQETAVVVTGALLEGQTAAFTPHGGPRAGEVISVKALRATARAHPEMALVSVIRAMLSEVGPDA